MNKKIKKLLSKMTMFDDNFMSVCFDNNIPLATLVLRIILDRNDIIVTEVKSQYNISTIKNKNCRLDVKMTDRDGKYESFNDGAHIIYVNGSYRGEDNIGYLMSDFNESEAEKMHYEEVKEVTNNTKKEIEIGGKKGMSELWENALKEEREEGRVEGMAKGRTEGLQELLAVVKEYKIGNITKEDAIKKLKITVEDFNVISK